MATRKFRSKPHFLSAAQTKELAKEWLQANFPDYRRDDVESLANFIDYVVYRVVVPSNQ